jgi:hypothetical protein
VGEADLTGETSIQGIMMMAHNYYTNNFVSISVPSYDCEVAHKDYRM